MYETISSKTEKNTMSFFSYNIIIFFSDIIIITIIIIKI